MSVFVCVVGVRIRKFIIDEMLFMLSLVKTFKNLLRLVVAFFFFFHLPQSDLMCDKLSLT